MLGDSPPLVLLLSIVTGNHFSTSTPISNESTGTSTDAITENDSESNDKLSSSARPGQSLVSNFVYPVCKKQIFLTIAIFFGEVTILPYIIFLVQH